MFALQIRVFCRVKPHPRSAVSTTADGQSVKLHAEGKDQSFTFDRVFGPQADQAAVFQEVSELVQSALDGYKVRMESLCCSVLVTSWYQQWCFGPRPTRLLSSRRCLSLRTYLY